MCSHYQAVKSRAQFERHFGLLPPTTPQPMDVWPGYASSFIRPHPHADAGDDAVSALEAASGSFGLLPHWAKDRKLGRHTYNARCETVATKPSFRDAWARAQHCIIPADAIFEPDWRTGRAVATRIALANSAPMGIAGLWSAWRSPQGEVLSFTMLTVNADAHPLMRHFHKPEDEKRMVVVLPPEYFGQWLQATPSHSLDLLYACPAPELVAQAEAPTAGQGAAQPGGAIQAALF
ncbi:MAG: SOS response-associated peptidase [Rhodoferax sp.]|nr:SOS response-associated peptidase [Rhodoferax sp.]